ncbi:hypothetical protein [Kitasatospora sp. NPDC001527]|uniref:hypothetical protein n=1 Tax=Kitasatospora sp. NPDC001527 TaxID=3154519 RepID=UPI003323E478
MSTALDKPDRPDGSGRTEQSGRSGGAGGAATGRTTGTSVARRRARTAVWSAAAAALLVLLTGIALGTGQVEMTAWEALRALAGYGDSGNVLVVQEFRAPRVVSALIAGAGAGNG